ncbi:MAG TPA: class I SAM-dependent methyltransferase [Gemmatimonadales bacterium]|nr:class I SAM-dependent methyltransferase [Gemmatimonadales bacterium]
MFEPRRPVSQRYRCTLSHPLTRLGGQYRILSLVGDNQRVLDVGCATGYLGEVLRRTKGCRVTGIDVDQEAVAIAAGVLDAALVWDVEEGDPPLHDERFDRIILGDVLEHLKRPDKALARLAGYLAPEGLIIASVPNIGYLPARLRVTLGQFDYQDLGHFDRTHLRFFTRRSVRQLFELSGLKITKLFYTGLPALLPVWPTLLAAKFVIVAQCP